MSMQSIRNQRAYAAMRGALVWLDNARSDARRGDWSAEDWERFAREAMSRARDALATEDGAADTRRRPRHSL